MKLVIEVDIGEEGGACRAHTFEYIAQVVMQVLDGTAMGQHGPFEPGPEDRDYNESGMCSILESFKPVENANLTKEEVDALPVGLRISLSKEKFNDKHTQDGGRGRYRVIDTSDGSVKELDEYTGGRTLNS